MSDITATLSLRPHHPSDEKSCVALIGSNTKIDLRGSTPLLTHSCLLTDVHDDAALSLPSSE